MRGDVDSRDGERHIPVPEEGPAKLRGDGAHAERRMMLAVLEDALQQLVALGFTRPGEMRSEPERWVFSNDRKRPFSFVNVCETLGLDPNWIREQVTAKIGARRGGSTKSAAGGDPR